MLFDDDENPTPVLASSSSYAPPETQQVLARASHPQDKGKCGESGRSTQEQNQREAQYLASRCPTHLRIGKGPTKENNVKNVPENESSDKPNIPRAPVHPILRTGKPPIVQPILRMKAPTKSRGGVQLHQRSISHTVKFTVKLPSGNTTFCLGLL